MTEKHPELRELDLQPHPRILPMLGEINIAQWRCIAELVDNSIDSFITAERADRAVRHPQVHVTLPTSDRQEARIAVVDNGPGMDPEMLENAVRAGWTGNDPFSNLGLFGMGFNIATARLGTVTDVWTTRQGDAEWCGVQIDFEALAQQKSFRTPLRTRPKRDRSRGGTEVVVSRLKAEHREWLCHARNRTRVVQELGKVYAAMLQPNGKPVSIRLKVNERNVRGRRHCVWDPERTINTHRIGTVAAVQSFDIHLEPRPFCTRCWQWLPSNQSECLSCQQSESVATRERRIHGWVGVQRYLHVRDFGIDFLRHGRKIELANKELFVWVDSDGREEKEYPIDDPRNRGRIVGEVHVDHCRVTYTKDRFDRTDPAWTEVMSVLRGEGPLRPEKAAELGFSGENRSPLYLLYQGFRRSNPKTKRAGGWGRLLVAPDNDRAVQMAERFYEGDRDYETDRKWWELVEEADRRALAEPVPGGRDTDPGAFWDGAPTTGETGDATTAEQTTVASAAPRRQLPSLSNEYVDDVTGLRWAITAYEVEDSDPQLNGRPWVLTRPRAAIWEFLVNVRHPVFRSATLTPADALYAELACSAADSARDRPSPPAFAQILAGIRERYASETKLDPAALSANAASSLTAMAKSLSRNVEPEDSVALFGDLEGTEQDAIWERMAGRTVPEPKVKILGSGRFLEFAPGWLLQRFFEQHPELFLDGRYWDVSYEGIDYGREDLTATAREQIVRYYSSLLTDTIWLAEQDLEELTDASRTRLLRAALAVDILESETAVEEDS